MLDNYCNICRGVDIKLLYTERNYFYGICKECGHVYQTFRKEAAHYHTLPYESQWNNYLEHSRNRANYVADFCKGYIEKATKLVDIGSGPGGTMKYLKKQFPSLEVKGITSLSDKKIMIEKFKAKFGDFEEDKDVFIPGCDFAIMCHVLEHFVDPQTALHKVNKMLLDKGMVYIEVPSFYRAEIRSNPQFCPVHLSYFTESKLKYLLHQAGFTVVKIHESKYWGNIKVLAVKEKSTEQQSLIEFWRFKLLKWYLNKLFINRIYKVIKKIIKVNAND